MAVLRLKLDPRQMEAGADKAERGLKGVTNAAHKTESAVDRMARNSGRDMTRMGRGFLSLKAKAGLAALAIAAVAASTKGLSDAIGLDASLAEASTLIKGTREQMDLLRKSAISMAAQFGGSATQQVQAFYQAISAGAGTVANAAKVLQTANELAVGGVTDIKTAVDVLTTATNAYKDSNLTSARASDVLFGTVKAGKTTVAELASSIGKAAPIASKLGVSFEELNSAVATLTLSGLSTSEAVTGVRGAMSAILKPTSEASKLAKKLGIDFSVSAIKTKGLIGVLKDITVKTGGSSEALSQLFGNVEGLSAAMVLAANDGKTFNAILSDVQNSAGATSEAADKVSQSLSKRLGVATGKVKLAFEALGGFLLSALVPALESLVSVGEFVVGIFTVIPDLFSDLVKSLGPVSGAMDTAGNAAFNVEIATKQLGEQLIDFKKNSAPEAGAAAIALANNNNKLAASALKVAKAELAKAQALQASFNANPNRARSLVTNKGESIQEINQKAFNARVLAATEAIGKAQEGVLITQMDIVLATKAVTDEAEKTAKPVEKTTIEIKKLGAAAKNVAPVFTRIKDNSTLLGETMTSVFSNAQSAFDQFIETGKISFRGFISSILKDLARAQFSNSLKGLFGGGFSGGGNSSIFNGLFGGGGLGSFFHNGGIVGQGGTMRPVPIGAFAGAPRMHNGGVAGLKPDEVPAILQRGERVLSRQQTRNGGGTTRVQIVLSPGLEANILSQAQEQSVEVTKTSLDIFNRHTLPQRVNQIAKNPKVIG